LKAADSRFLGSGSFAASARNDKMGNVQGVDVTENEVQKEQALPDGWVWTTLGEVTEPSSEKANPKEIHRTHYIGLEHIDSGTGKLLGSGSSDEVRSTKAVFHRGDLLYGKLRPYLNKVHVVDFDGVCSTDILVFPDNPNISNRFLFYRLLSGDFVRYANLNVSGVQHPRTHFSILSQFPLALSPLPEQRRIVAEIETQFTRLDAGVAALERARANLKRYRAAVLKAACEGRLVPTEAALARADGRAYEPAGQLLARILAERRAHWQAAHPGKRYVEPAAPETGILPELPEGWCWAILDQCFKVERGRFAFRPRNEPRFYYGPYPFVQIGDLPRDGGNITGFQQTLNENGLEISKWFPKGTVLIAIVGATIGNTGILTFDSCCPDSLVAIQADAEVRLRYVEFFLRSKKLEIRQSSYASGGQPNINLRTLLPYPFPLPPFAEQYRIVAEVERRLSVVAALEREVEAALARAARLRQSILKRAFEGRLVLQDPGDEPVSALLERIRAAREAPATGGKKRRTRQMPLPMM